MLRSREVAELCGVDVSTVQKWAARGQLPSFRTPGGQLRFLAAEVRGFLKRRDKR